MRGTPFSHSLDCASSLIPHSTFPRVAILLPTLVHFLATFRYDRRVHALRLSEASRLLVEHIALLDIIPCDELFLERRCASCASTTNLRAETFPNSLSLKRFIPEGHKALAHSKIEF